LPPGDARPDKQSRQQPVAEINLEISLYHDQPTPIPSQTLNSFRINHIPASFVTVSLPQSAFSYQ